VPHQALLWCLSHYDCGALFNTYTQTLRYQIVARRDQLEIQPLTAILSMEFHTHTAIRR